MLFLRLSRIAIGAAVLFALLCAFVAPCAAAERVPIVITVLPSARHVDAEALRDAVSRDLGVEVLAPDDPAASSVALVITVGEDEARGELAVARRNGDNVLIRRVAIPRDVQELQQAAVFLIGNIARDEAWDLVGAIRPRPVEPPAPEPTKVTHAPAPKRLWLGVSAEGNLAFMPSGDDACLLNASAISVSGFVCMRDGRDYPALPAVDPAGAENQRIVPGKSDEVSGGLVFGNARFSLSADYAMSDDFLLGVRAGYTSATYPGQRVAPFGHLSLEARGTYLIGSQPLAHAGTSFAIAFGAGVAETSAHVSVTVLETGVDGGTRAEAWRIAGPWFVAAGTGVRFAPTDSTALIVLPLRYRYAFGSDGTLASFAPEIAMQIGFD